MTDVIEFGKKRRQDCRQEAPGVETGGFSYARKSLRVNDAGGGTRTLKGLLPPDFESGASASSATPALVCNYL